MDNRIVCKDQYNVKQIVDSLLDEDYVVMLYKEEEYCVIDFLWVPDGDKRHVVFRTIEEDQDLIDNAIDDFITSLREDGKLK